MKKAKLLLAFAVGIICLSATSAQSQNIREIEINNEDQSLYMRYKGEELIIFKVDGKFIPSKDYHLYDSVLDKYATSTPVPPTPPSPYGDLNTHHKDQNGEYNRKLRTILVDNDLISNLEKYRINLTVNKLSVNGKTIDQMVLDLSLVAFESVFGYELSHDSCFSAKIRKNSKSISLSVSN